MYTRRHGGGKAAGGTASGPESGRASAASTRHAHMAPGLDHRSRTSPGAGAGSLPSSSAPLYKRAGTMTSSQGGYSRVPSHAASHFSRMSTGRRGGRRFIGASLLYAREEVHGASSSAPSPLLSLVVR